MTALRPALLLRAGLLATALLAAPAAFAVVHDAGHGVTVDRRVAPQHRGAETLHAVRLDRRDFQANASAGRALDLPATGNATMRARFVRAEQQGDNYTWVGKVDTDLGEQAAVVTIGPDAVFGTIPQVHGQPLRLESHAGRTWLVEGHGRDPMAGADDARVQQIAQQARAAATAKPTPAPVIDVLVAYTPSMVSRLGSDTAVRTRIAFLEQLANQAFMDTPAKVRIHVVASRLMDYTAASSNAALLELVTRPSSNATKAQVDAWRDQYGADLVVALRAYDARTQHDCGQAWIGGYHGAPYVETSGFSVVADGSNGGDTCPDDAFVHQLGHNLGGQHDRATAEGDFGAFADWRGFRETITPTVGFATILATPVPPQVRLNRFSNDDAAACMRSLCGQQREASMAGKLDDAGWQVASYRGTGAGKQSTITVDVGGASILEGNSGSKSLNFRLTLSEASPTPVTVGLSTTSAGYTATAGVDYVAFQHDVVIPAGATTYDVPVTILCDTTSEFDETLALVINHVAGNAVGDVFGVGVILNDDLPPLWLDDAEVLEGDSGTQLMRFQVRVLGVHGQPITLKVSTLTTATTTATPGEDFEPTGPVTFTIPATTSCGNCDNNMAFYDVLTVPIHGDAKAEANEVFLATVSEVVGATVNDGAAKGVIRNDDPPLLSISDASVTEGNSGTKYAVFTATLSIPTTETVGFNYEASNLPDGPESAIPGEDFLTGPAVQLTIPPGQLSKTISIPIRGDTVAERHEKFALRIDAMVGAEPGTGSLGPPNNGGVSGLGTILNDDQPSIAIDDAVITEGNSGSQLLSFTIHTSSVSSNGVYFDIATVPTGTATAGSDYVARTLANVGIPPGQQYATFNVSIVGDSRSEDHETFGVAITNVRGATVADAEAVAMIGNDDPVVWRIADATLVEGNNGTRQMAFVLSLSSTANVDSTVYVHTVDSAGATAKPGTDYTAASGFVTIPRGKKSAAFVVPILTDTVKEADEVFVVTLGTPSGGLTVADGAAKGTITNDD